MENLHQHPILERIINWLRKAKSLDGRSQLVAVIQRGELQTLSDGKAVKLLRKQFRHEFSRLRRVPDNLEQGDGPPKGMIDGKDVTPSQLLFHQDFPEVNRTVVNFLALKWLLEDNYNAFTKYQPEVLRLKEETFKKFRDLARGILDNSPDDLLASVVSLILGDIGKDPELKRWVNEYGGKKINHDLVLLRAIELGQFSKSLGLLPDNKREDLILGVRVGAALNIPQLTQGENVPGSLRGILMLRGNEQAFNLKYLEIMLDVSGAGGHVDARGANRMIEPVCQSFLLAFPVLQDVIKGNISVRDAYDKVLGNRGQILADKGFRPLSTDDPRDRAFLRLCAMGRVADEHLARLFDEAFTNLPGKTKQKLIDGLNVDGDDDGEAVILYYMPGIFAEGLRVSHEAPDLKQVEVIQSLMSFMARSYDDTKPHSGRPNRIIERDVSPAKSVVRNEHFVENPQILDTYNLPVATY
ncbi:hypothetical protein BDV29DRAFT_168423 [Aspergillus leporis]|uniref:Uncharacterized protein n=1 Tax=Aspergillus leporis TaxID=41062 RepID=A0A5N5X998_9EURO|nr:hypothetical protein BDV29DRAFT_168423 [Aspergillus leporis]